jgi:hypothetical protein
LVWELGHFENTKDGLRGRILDAICSEAFDFQGLKPRALLRLDGPTEVVP